jgi:TrmH family RNA methyltransferase
VLVLDGVQDLGNLGTIVRTCQAFGIREVLSTSPKLDLYQRKTIDASRGSVFSARFGRCESPKAAIRRLKTLGYQVVATSPRGTSLQSLVQLDPRPVALVVGNESTGISPAVAEQADWLVQIPMSEAIESLNVGVAAGISVYELRLKQVLTMIEQRIKSTLGRELNVAGMLVQQALDAELRKVSNLDSRRVIFMMVLKCDCTMSVEDMCKQFGVLQSEAQAFLVPLLKAGLVTHDDVLELTPSGEQVLAKLWFTVQATEDKILSEFTPEQAAALRQQLTHVQRRCLEIIDDSGPRSS